MTAFDSSGKKRTPARILAKLKSGNRRAYDRETVPIVVALYHREEDTRRMFKQLDKVTDNYSLIIVNNGFDDSAFLKKLKPARYIENEVNTGAIRPINQGLQVAEGKYVAVLHNDLLIYDEGWLDHIIEFMERRPDVGLVGLAGRHGIGIDGTIDLETTVVNMTYYPYCFKPTWRLTEVATIDGLGWVMRNNGFLLEESFGFMHAYDFDLSLQFIEAGYRVYVASVEIEHLAEFEGRSTRSKQEYLDRVGGDDDAYYDEVVEKFRQKWEHMLPISRGFRDENYAYERIEHLVKDNKAKEVEILKAKDYFYKIEKEINDKNEYVERLELHIKELAARIEKLEAQLIDKKEARRAKRRAKDPGPPITPESSVIQKLRFYLRTEGFVFMLKRSVPFVKRRLPGGS